MDGRHEPERRINWLMWGLLLAALLEVPLALLFFIGSIPPGGVNFVVLDSIGVILAILLLSTLATAIHEWRSPKVVTRTAMVVPTIVIGAALAAGVFLFVRVLVAGDVSVAQIFERSACTGIVVAFSAPLAARLSRQSAVKVPDGPARESKSKV